MIVEQIDNFEEREERMQRLDEEQFGPLHRLDWDDDYTWSEGHHGGHRRLGSQANGEARAAFHQYSVEHVSVVETRARILE